VLYPATRLDWLVLLRLTVATLSNTPGIPAGPPGHVLKVADWYIIHTVAPVALAVAVAGLAVLAISGRWGLRYPPRIARVTADDSSSGSSASRGSAGRGSASRGSASRGSASRGSAEGGTLAEVHTRVQGEA